MNTSRCTFLLAAGAGALSAPLLAQASAGAADAAVSYDSRLMGMPKFVDVDGIRTRYFDAGRGPVLVLIHGGQWPATASADGFAAIFDRLAARYHVYAFDKLGMGFTDAPKSAAGYSMDAIVRHAYGFIRAAGTTRAIVAGHSRGALPAVRIAADHPELVTHASLPKTQQVARGFRAAKEQWVREHPDRVQADPALINETGAAVWWLVDAKHATIDLIRAGHLKMPVCIIWGWNDKFAPYRFGLSAMDIISETNDRTEMHFVNHAGHFVFAEQPVEVTRLINSFIQAYP